MDHPSETMSDPASSPESRQGVDWIRVILYSTAFFIAIALLSSLGLTNRVREQARRAQAKSEATQLVAGLKQFATEYGFLPTGTNTQIVATLRGDNPRKIVFFECVPHRINALGEFIDPWKTPYRIDTTNPKFPWAYSFGTDRQDNGGAAGSDDVPSW